MTYQDEILATKTKYHSGMRIELISMFDRKHPIKPTTTGTIQYIDNGGNIHVDWDTKENMVLIPEVDQFKVLN